MKPRPETDGIDHINIYSKGKTELGRLLSNFSFSLFQLPDDGRFFSVEGYWYWLLSSSLDKDKLRMAFGFEAKNLGRQLANRDDPNQSHSDEFKQKIFLALLAKTQQNPKLLGLLIKSELPFSHYYSYDKKIVHLPKYDWIVEFWEKIRKEQTKSRLGT